MVAVTVNGSPICPLFGFASVAIVKRPTAPPKDAGGFGGSVFTSSIVGSLFNLISRGVLGANAGSLKKLSKNGSFMLKRSRGIPGLRDMRGIRTTGLTSTGPI